MKSNKALIVTTSHASLGGTPERTGVWMGCLASAYWGLRDAGLDVDIASMRGGQIPIDSRSLGASGSNAPSVERFMRDANAQRALAKSPKLRMLDPSAFCAVILPGGHGCLWDQVADADLGRTVERILAAGGVAAAICHGVAGLLSPGTSGTPALARRSATAFTLREEQTVGLDTVVPFILEQRVRETVATFKAGVAFEPFTVRDGSLITGQNPASARLVVEELVTTLLASGTDRKPATHVSGKRIDTRRLPAANDLH
jgi:putative intracellular protease/amidase